jgi:hypothetical protein
LVSLGLVRTASFTKIPKVSQGTKFEITVFFVRFLLPTTAPNQHIKIFFQMASIKLASGYVGSSAPVYFMIFVRKISD